MKQNKTEQLDLMDCIQSEKMIVNFPSYSHWVRQLQYHVGKQLTELGCEIISDEGYYLITAVPDHWYFISKGEKYLEIYGNKERTQYIGVIKEHINTGLMLTIIGDN